MSLFVLPVTNSDITALQQGITFTTTTAADIASKVASINAPNATLTVASYANSLLAGVQNTAQMAMGVTALMTNNNQPVATLSNLVNNPAIIPLYVSFAVSQNLDIGLVVGEDLGLAFSGDANFVATYGGLTLSAFSSAAAGVTGINQAELASTAAFFINFYTANGLPGIPNPTAAQIQSAAYGVAFGLGVALAIEGIGTQATTIQGQVRNALFDIAQTSESPPGQTYVPGGPLASHPVPTPFQSGPNVTGVFLTQNIDSPTAGFSSSPTGTPLLNGFTATLANTTFQALPVVTALGLANNTLNIGDDLEATGAAAGATSLVYTTTPMAAANPAFAQNVTMNGVNQATITNAFAGVGGFQGANISGLLIENNTNSVGNVTVGGTGQGLKSLLTNINISGNEVTGPNFLNTVVLAAGAADATKTINIDLKGTLGSTDKNSAATLAISNDVGGGTAASPNNTYGTWSITAANNSNLQLDPAVTTAAGVVTEGGVGGATKLVLAAAGSIAVGQATPGGWQKLTTADLSKTTGMTVLTGATSGTSAAPVATQARASTANPAWLFGSETGLLNEGAGTFALTSVLLGGGPTIVDVSSASATQVAALTTASGTGGAVNPGNEIIVNNSVATVTALSGPNTFKNIAGFSDLGIGGPAAADGAGGTIDMKVLDGTFNTISYITKSSAALTVNNQTNALTINTFDNGAGNAITVGAVAPAAGLNDSFKLIVGDTFHAPGLGAVGNLTLIGDEVVTLSSVGFAPGANTVGFAALTPTLGGLEAVTIDGTNDLTLGVIGKGAIAAFDAGGALLVNALSITITNSGVVRMHSTTGGAEVLDLTVPGGAGGNGSGGSNPLTNSTNARLIDNSKGGGLIMEGGDANFVTSATVAGSLGDVIIGSATSGNVLGGSIGNDVFTSNVTGLADTIFTSGGADKITLTPGHTGSNSLDMYSGFSTAGVTPGTAEIVRFGSITNGNDVSDLGWFGQATGVVAKGYDATGNTYAGLAANTGVSAANSTATTITNFNAGSDIIQLSDSTSGYGVGVNGANGVGAGVTIQLVNASLAQFTALGVNGTPVNVQQVNPGDILTGANNFFELTTGTFATQTAVAAALHGAYNLVFSAFLGANNSAHIYAAYSDGTNTHIADVALVANAGVSNHTGGGAGAMTEHVSDIAIVGVPLTSLTGANVHVMHG